MGPLQHRGPIATMGRYGPFVKKLFRNLPTLASDPSPADHASHGARRVESRSSLSADRRTP